MLRLVLLIALSTLPLAGDTEMPLDIPSEDLARRFVALLFDDGPDFANSSRLLGILEERGVRASFAQIGQHVRAHPELTRAAASAGHQIINHSMTHGRVAEMDDATLRQEMLDPLPVFERAMGRTPTLYWPPFVAYEPRMDAVAKAGNMRILHPQGFQFVSSDDWNTEATSREEIRRNALSGLEKVDPGASDLRLILFHEWRDDTIAVLPGILAELDRRGYRFVTVDELLELSAGKAD